MWHRIFIARHVSKAIGQLDLCDIISTSENFQLVGSFIFKIIWISHRQMDGLVHWKMPGSSSRWDLANRPIWRWKMQGTCISNLPRFQARMFSKNKLFIWRDLWGFISHSWKDWCLVAQYFSLTSSNRSTLKDIIGIISKKEIFKINIDMSRPFWWDWEWSFKHPLMQYDSHSLYSILHHRHVLGPLLNSIWVFIDEESDWTQRLHSA